MVFFFLLHRESLEVQILDALKVCVTVVHQLFSFQFIERQWHVDHEMIDDR